jgi:Flp pilus assembly protein TadG
MRFGNRNNRNRRKGNLIVELALASSLMVPLLAGTFQFGYSLYVYNNLQNAARAGARFASLRTYTSTTATPAADYTNEVKNMVVYGDPIPAGYTSNNGNGNGNGNGGGSTNTITAPPVLRGLTTNNVEVTVTMNGTVPGTVTVRIINFTVDGLFNQFTFQKPAVTYTYNGS